jgi:two-component system chemotaxis response regulator CheB
VADAGGHAVVQDPETAEVRVMPRSALKAVPESCVLPLEEIGPHLSRIHGRRVPPCRAVTA